MTSSDSSSRLSLGCGYDDAADSVQDLALQLIAQSQYRDSTLHHVIAAWARRADAHRLKVQRLERIAEGFHGHRVTFTAFRAWQWAFSQRRLSAVRAQQCEYFRRLSPSRVAWKAWRRVVALRRRQRAACDRMYTHVTVPHVLLCRACAVARDAATSASRCDACHVSVSRSPTSAFFCRWRRLARLKSLTEHITQTAAHEHLRLRYTQWLTHIVFVVRPAKLLESALSAKKSFGDNVLQYHSHLLTEKTNRLRRWLDAVKAVVGLRRSAEAAVSRTYLFHWWKRVTVVRRLQLRTATCASQKFLRKWVRWVTWRRYDRHIHRHALQHDASRVLRGVVRLWNIRMAQRRDAHTAALFSDVSRSRQPRRVFDAWRAALSLREERRRLAIVAQKMRHSLLVTLALRRLGEVEDRVAGARGGSSTPAGIAGAHAAGMPSRTQHPQSLAQSHSTTFGVEDSLREQAAAGDGALRFLSTLQHQPIPRPQSHAAYASYPAARNPTPTPYDTARLPAPCAHRDHLNDASGGARFSLAQEQHLRRLLEQYRVLRSVQASEAVRLQAAVDQRIQLQRRSLWCETPDSTNSQQQQQQQQLAVLDNEISYLRQRNETRATLRAEICLLQRALRSAIGATTDSSSSAAHHDVFRSASTSSAVLAPSNELLLTPRGSESSYAAGPSAERPRK